jgi:hypothetical protein
LRRKKIKKRPTPVRFFFLSGSANKANLSLCPHLAALHFLVLLLPSEGRELCCCDYVMVRLLGEKKMPLAKIEREALPPACTI